MIKYTGNSYYLIIRILFLTIPIIGIGFILYKIDNTKQVIYGALTTIALILLYIAKLLTNLVFVEFNNDGMIITYWIPKKIVTIPYSKIVKFTCIDGQRGSHFNKIKFRKNNFLGTNKIILDRIVHSDKFVSFVSWLKDKNDKIEFKIVPSDSKLIHEYNKTFTKRR